MPSKKLTAAEKMDLNVKRMLGGFLSEIGGPEELGRQSARLGAETVDDQPTTVPVNIRSNVLSTFSKLLGLYGEDDIQGEGDISEDAVDQEVNRLLDRQREAAEGFDGDE